MKQANILLRKLDGKTIKKIRVENYFGEKLIKIYLTNNETFEIRNYTEPTTPKTITIMDLYKTEDGPVEHSASFKTTSLD